jgi:hypothetical protein
VIGAIELGRASRLGFPIDPLAPLLGRPALARTVDAVLRSPSIESLLVLAPAPVARDVEAALSAAGLPCGVPASRKGAGRGSGGRQAAGARLVVLSCDGEDIPGRLRIRRLRRLAPSAWRAGWSIPYAVAESGNPRWLLQALERAGGEKVMLFPPAAPLLDPAAIEEVAAGAARHRGNLVRLSTAPPGVAGDVLDRALIEECARRGIPADLPMRFAPDAPDRALENKEVFHWFGRGISEFATRLSAESRRGLALLEAILADPLSRADPAGASSPGGVLRALSGRPDLLAGPFPCEVRLQVTARSRGGTAASVGPTSAGAAADMDPGLVAAIAREAGSWEESRILIHGGEPLLHPLLPEVLAAARAGGAGIVEVETDGIGLEPRSEALLLETADVISIRLDACGPETYRALHPGGALEDVEASVIRLLEAAAAAGGWPVVAVRFRLVAENRDEAETFFDRWHPRSAFVVVDAPSDRAGQLPGRALHPGRTPARIPCRRLIESLQVLPGGLAVACENDFLGLASAGDLARSSVAEVWRSEALGDLRAAHARGEWDRRELCARCSDWCRP